MMPEYKCTLGCQQPKARDELSVKKAVFQKLGPGGRIIRSRSVGWICDTCRELDPDYLREPWSESPGNRKQES